MQTYDNYSSVDHGKIILTDDSTSEYILIKFQTIEHQHDINPSPPKVTKCVHWKLKKGSPHVPVAKNW